MISRDTRDCNPGIPNLVIPAGIQVNFANLEILGLSTRYPGIFGIDFL